MKILPKPPWSLRSLLPLSWYPQSNIGIHVFSVFPKGSSHFILYSFMLVRGCIQKFPDLPPVARTANGTAVCPYVQLYRYFVSQCSEFCRHNPLCCFSTSVYFCKRIFRYRLSPETFGYTLPFLWSISSAYRCACDHVGMWSLVSENVLCFPSRSM
jgi:hypothetical protein